MYVSPWLFIFRADLLASCCARWGLSSLSSPSPVRHSHPFPSPISPIIIIVLLVRAIFRVWWSGLSTLYGDDSGRSCIVHRQCHVQHSHSSELIITVFYLLLSYFPKFLIYSIQILYQLNKSPLRAARRIRIQLTLPEEVSPRLLIHSNQNWSW